MSAIIRACATLARCWAEEALRGRLVRTVIAPLADDAKAMAADAKEEHDQLRADLATVTAERDEWAKAYDANGFGPRSPAEVAVFLRERDRVNGQVAACELSKDCALLEQAREHLRVQTAALADDLATSRSVLASVHAAWALQLLLEGEAHYSGLVVPAPVRALMRVGAGRPIGACDAEGCGKTSALVPSGSGVALVCAPGWPCGEERSKGDGG